MSYFIVVSVYCMMGTFRGVLIFVIIMPITKFPPRKNLILTYYMIMNEHLQAERMVNCLLDMFAVQSRNLKPRNF